MKNTLLAIALAALLGTAHYLDMPADVAAEAAMHRALTDVLAQQASEQRREAAAAALCRQHGEADYRWDADGALWCVPRRAKPVKAAL